MKHFTRRGFTARLTALLGAASMRIRFGMAQAWPVAAGDLVLHYDKPASEWVNALPIGNGRIGAMVFGGEWFDPGVSYPKDKTPTGLPRETLQLSQDILLWSGMPVDGNVTWTRKTIWPKGAPCCADGQELSSRRRDLSQMMQGLFAEAFQPSGNLFIDFDHKQPVSGYTRASCDLKTAVMTTRYTVDGVWSIRAADICFSAPDRAIVVRLRASRSRARWSFMLRMGGLLAKPAQR